MKLSDDLLKDKTSEVFNFIDFEAAQQSLNKDKKHWNLLQLGLWAENSKSK